MLEGLDDEHLIEIVDDDKIEINSCRKRCGCLVVCRHDWQNFGGFGQERPNLLNFCSNTKV